MGKVSAIFVIGIDQFFGIGIGQTSGIVPSLEQTWTAMEKFEC